METLTDSFEVEGQTVHIELEQYATSDLYATNLELTGQGTWFGSLHMCNFIAAEARNIFHTQATSSSISTKENNTIENEINKGRPLSLLELGSGLGRAGLMAAKVMSIIKCPGVCVLTDGEPSIVNLLQRNIERNHNNNSSDNKCDHKIVKIECQKLWWGLDEDLDPICDAYPDGFDVIIGADLVYGHEIHALCTSLMQTVLKVIGEGQFILAFTRRDVPIEQVIDIAKKNGLDANVHPDWTLDIFEESVDFESEMWRDTIVIFTKSKKKESDSIDNNE